MKQYVIVDTSPPSKPRSRPQAENPSVFVPSGHSAINPAVELPGMRGGVSYSYNNTYKIRNNSEAEYLCTWLLSDDTESGLLRYEYKVTNKRDETITTNWISSGMSRRVTLSMILRT